LANNYSLDQINQNNPDFLPKLTITGAGIDLENVPAVDLVASLMNIVAPIYGDNNEVNLRAGDLNFYYSTKETTSNNTNPENNNQEALPDRLAIDASALAKIQAGKIYIIATKEGFGIKYSADLLASRNGVIIDSAGNVTYNNIATSKGDINIKAKGNINHIVDNSAENNSGQIISAGNVNIESRQSFTNTRIITANNNINITTNNNFTNGSLDGDNNSNIIIAAKNNINITAHNLLANYATISSDINLSLTSINEDINNNQYAHIIGGSGKLTLLAKNGTVNQNSSNSLVSNGDLELDVENFTNDGRVDIAEDFTLTVANDLINQADSFIYSGGDMTLNVGHNLINNSGGVIYAENNLTIQKHSLSNELYDENNNRINQLDNISGQIANYDGDMTIKADILNNKRAINPFNSLIDPESTGTIYTKGVLPDNYSSYQWDYKDGWCQGNWCLEKYNIFYARQLYNLNSIPSQINSAGTLNFDAGQLNNLASNISSQGNMTISANTLNNKTIYDSGLRLRIHYNSEDNANNIHAKDFLITTLQGVNEYAQSSPSSIKSGGTITLNTQNDISNETSNQNSGDVVITTQTPQFINGININDLKINGTVNDNLGNYINGNINQGLFTKNSDITAPLFETRSQFIDQSKFFSSNYFYTKLGLDLEDVQTQFEQQNKRLVGDQFFQNQFIEKQLQSINKNRFLISATQTNTQNETKQLIDNASSEYSRLALDLNEPLTQNQINLLQKDIIWFETQTVNGQDYIVPKIYLSQESRNAIIADNGLMAKSTIYAKNNANLTSESGAISNNGSITAGNNITLTANNDITNKNFSDITATNNLTATSNSGSITNLSELKAGNSITLTANNDITNSSTVSTNDASLLASGNPAYTSLGVQTTDPNQKISSALLETAKIEAGSLTINAGGDFNNKAATITTDGNAAIQAVNNINISTLNLRNRSENSWGHASKGGVNIVDTTTNVSSNINIGGNLDITSTGLSDTATTANINIIGSNVNVAGNGSLTSEFGNVNIANAVDYKMTEETSSKSGTFHSSYDSVYDYKETAAESKLNFGGDLAVNAELGEINLIGSTLKTGGDLNIGSFTVARNLDGSYQTNADGTFQTIDGGSVAGVNIKAAELRSEHSEIHTKSKLSLGDTLKTLTNPFEMAKLGADTYLFMVRPSLKKDVLEFNNGPKYEKASAKSSTANITQHSATLDIGGNMMMNSTGDVNIVASNIDVVGNALMNVDGNVNILSAAEKTTSGSKNEEIKIGTFKLSRDLAHASNSAGLEGAGTKFEDSLRSSTQKSSNINIGGSMLANVTNEAEILNSGNLTLLASNLTVGGLTNGNSLIRTAGDFNLTDAQNTSSYSSKASELTVEIGAKIGNAYVDTGYAWKAVLDAQKQAIKAAKKLKKMKDLESRGKASSKAVALAAAQLVLAQTAVTTATVAAATATAGAATAASTSLGSGFYGAGYMSTTATGVKNTAETSLSKVSNFTSYTDINITSNNNINLLGSMLDSVNGNITLDAANDINIEAGVNTLSQSSKQETIYGGGSVGNNGVQLNIGMSSGESDYNKTYYTNSQVLAENGTLTLNTGNDANIFGANLLARNVALNVENDLNIKSKQTEEDYSSSGFGFNFGAGVGAGGNGGNISTGFNVSNADMHRLWVDDITTIKGTNSMAVNVGKDLNLTGAAILSDNLTLAVSGNINKKELADSYYSESMSIGVSTNITNSGNQPTNPGTGGKPNSFPGGSTTIEGSYAQNESNRTVYATIGGLDSKLASETKDMINGDFEGSITIDHRLLSESGRENIGNDFENLGENLKTIREEANKSPLKIGAILNTPNTLLEGAIYTFSEEKDVEGGAQLRIKNLETGKIEIITDPALAKIYAMNGINNNVQDIIDSYLKETEAETIVERENPTHGPLGDLVESGLGKIFDWVGLEDVIAMNRIAREDMHARKDIENAINLYHSQGTIIAKGAMQAYSDSYLNSHMAVSGNNSGIDVTYTNQINPSQKFVAVGPAVSESDWYSTVKALGGNKLRKKADWSHDVRDPVRYLASPSNLTQDAANLINPNIKSPIYVPNLWDTVLGIYHLKDMNNHSVTNDMYQKFIDPTIEKNQF
jgi:adhesin HecA-like repeat protein